MSMITRCRCCNKPLALNPTAWSSRDGMYCSATCGINAAKKMYRAIEYTGEIDLSIKARAYFKDVAEEISREDYGARAERFTAYSKDYDISTVFEQTYEGDELISQTVVNWYYGEPDEELDKDNSLTAIFVED